MNQFATPGLGSLMARRYVAGAIQLALALIGFLAFLVWFLLQMVAMYRLASGQEEQPAQYPWMGWGGVVIFVASWLLAWPTSISVFRESRKRDASGSIGAGVPPVIRS